ARASSRWATGRTSRSATTPPIRDASSTGGPTLRSFLIISLLSQPALAKPPKLALVVVVDQLRRAEVERMAPHLTGGFKRMRDGAAALDGHYGQQNTYTGPGHALILSGSYGYMNGVMQNKWFNRATNRSEGMLYDPDSRPLGQ